jgi:two-component system, LytTR family, sensor kinase
VRRVTLGSALPFRWVSYYLAIWTALAVVFAGQSLLYALQAHRPFRAGAALFSSMLFWYLWGVLGLVVLRLADRFPIGGHRARRYAAVHALTGVIVAGCHVVLRAAAERAFNGTSADGAQTFFVEQFHLDLLVYWGIVGASHAITFHWQAVARAAEVGALASRAANLEAMVATAQLNALRAQLEPHFLFNTLQAVSTLMRHDVGLADRTLGQLSTLLRRIVDAADVQEVPLCDELQLVGEYLAIQSTRFQAHLAVETHVGPGIENALVPILVMQPLIENACLHGISRRPSGGRVILRAERVRDGATDARSRGPHGVLRLSVTNDGPESQISPELPDTGSATREGVGLSNTRKRLEALYGEQQMIALRPRPGGGVETIIEIPLHWSSGDPPETSRTLEVARE